MAKQLNLLATGQIIPTALHLEMEQSYLEYAMSVIVGRALPDVRDGLKPVHRRILYAMHELGLTPDRPFRKCARVVGDVLGKYHPHGDQSVYDALVRMVQEFSSRYPLLAGHGNFGSVDNDPAAAMRYTETRLSPIAHQGMLSDISEAIVNFSNNFDNSQQEPVVLPAQLPILLLNGCAGIAVGMATNIPPHNLGEIVDGLIALIDQPELKDEQLWKLIPGPDFPTGGEILETEGIREAYRTGRGLIPVRGIAKIEQLYIEKRRRKERTAIVVSELPYQVNKAAWVEKVAELVNQGKLEGIADLRDESDRTGMRVVIELKREVNPQTVLDGLYRQTALKTNFGVILLALVNNKPCQLTLRQLLTEFLNFREQTLTRQYTHELEEAQKRLHLLEGSLIALSNLDAMIDILRNAADGTTAKVQLRSRFEISDAQADSILAMPMRRLTGLERQKIQAEAQELQGTIEELQTLISDRHERLKALKKDLRSLKRKFGDQRRTRILTPRQSSSEKKVSSSPKISQPKSESKKVQSPPSSHTSHTPHTPPSLPLTLFTPQTPPEDAVLIISHQGYLSWHPPQSPPPASKTGDFPVYTATIGKQTQLLVMTDRGKAYPVAVPEIPPADKGQQSLTTLLPNSAQRDSEKAVAHFFLPEAQKSPDLLLLSQQGRIKRLSTSEFMPLTQRGVALIKLKDDDRLGYVCLAQEEEEVAIATTGGRVLRLEINDQQLPILGRSAQGHSALRLRYGEHLVGCVTLKIDDNLVLISQLGYGKRLPLHSLRLANPGDIGTHALQFTSKIDNLAGMVKAKTGSKVILLTSSDRQLSLAVDSVSFWGKDGAGDPVAKLKPNETILKILNSEF